MPNRVEEPQQYCPRQYLLAVSQGTSACTRCLWWSGRSRNLARCQWIAAKLHWAPTMWETPGPLPARWHLIFMRWGAIRPLPFSSTVRATWGFKKWLASSETELVHVPPHVPWVPAHVKYKTKRLEWRTTSKLLVPQQSHAHWDSGKQLWVWRIKKKSHTSLSKEGLRREQITACYRQLAKTNWKL